MGDPSRPAEPHVTPEESAPPPHPEREEVIAPEDTPDTGRRRRRKALAWGSGALALLLVAAGIGGYAILRHFDTNIEQDNIAGMLGSRPVDLHPKAENILVLGSDSRHGLGRAYGTGLVTDQSDTMMVIHIPANRQWAEVMSIPRDSWVHIPACEMGNGQLSQPEDYKINSAFATGNLDGNHTALGVACAVKTLEQNTGIYINHFVVVNFTGFENMVSALGGVPECNPTPINDPKSGLVLAAGKHTLTPKQALGYVRARYSIGDGSDLNRIGRQQAFMSALISRVHGELLNPVAMYRFLDAATRSLTIDSQLGGIRGLYNLGQSLRGIPSSKIAFFTVPSHPRSDVVPGDTANVLWTQPEDNAIFASFRDDVPASSKLFDTKQANTPDPGASDAGQASDAATDVSAGSGGSPSAPAAAPSATPSPSAPSVDIQSRTANQDICAG